MTPAEMLDNFTLTANSLAIIIIMAWMFSDLRARGRLLDMITSIFNTLDKFYDHLHALADIFDVVGNNMNRILNIVEAIAVAVLDHRRRIEQLEAHQKAALPTVGGDSTDD